MGTLFYNGESLEESLKAQYLSSLHVGKNTNYLRINAAEVRYFNNGFKVEKEIFNNYKYYPEEALKHPYITANSNYNLSWLIFDIDSVFNLTDLEDLNIPYPNIYIGTTEKGTHPGGAQLWYLLENPVWMQEMFSKKEKGVTSFQYARAVWEAMNKKLNGDVCFSRKLSKNPWYKCQEWKSFFLQEKAFSLGELSMHLDLETPIENKLPEVESKSLQPLLFELPEIEALIPEGKRNDTLFNETRKQAYSFYKASSCSERQLFDFCMELLRKLNRGCRDKTGYLTSPLNEKELNGIAKSISSWTYGKNFSDALFHKYTDKQRAYALEVRRRNREINKNELRIYLNKKGSRKLSNRGLSRLFTQEKGKGFSTDTINTFMKELEAEKQLYINARENKKKLQEMKAESKYFNSDCVNIAGERILSVCYPMGMAINENMASREAGLLPGTS